MSEHRHNCSDETSGPVWRELCARLNELSRAGEGGWWRRIADDGEAVIRVDGRAVVARLRGNAFAEIGLRGGEPQCRIAPEHLLLTHPGGRVMLDGSDGVRCVRTLDELDRHYALVRRRICSHTDRRQAILDRLYLRHACVLAVDVPIPPGRADLVALSPAGTAVFFLLRRFDDGDLRLKGRGGAVWRMRELDLWLSGPEAPAWVEKLLERCSVLDTLRSRRYMSSRFLAVHPRSGLLVVDFDHAQRLGALPDLRAGLEHGLDRSASESDIHCIGDAGNISYGTFFSGI